MGNPFYNYICCDGEFNCHYYGTIQHKSLFNPQDQNTQDKGKTELKQKTETKTQ